MADSADVASSLSFCIVLCFIECRPSQGDASVDLDYYDESSLVLADNSTITGDNGVDANLDLPPVGYAAVYRLGTGASLGANQDIAIDTTPPIVVRVCQHTYIAGRTRDIYLENGNINCFSLYSRRLPWCGTHDLLS